MKYTARSTAIGFSLIELLVFMMVLLLFTGAVIRVGHQSTMDISEKMQRAHLLHKAQSLIEQLTATTYSKIKLRNNETIIDEKGLNFIITVGYDGGRFQLPQADVKLITVKVTSQDKESILLSTYRFAY